jgi:hypothetical protein
MKQIKTKVKLPRCWQKLITVDFPDDLAGITSEKYCKGNADPEPHYDDVREIGGKFSDGATFTIVLASGQSNYYGLLVIKSPNHDILYDNSDDVYESWADTLEAYVQVGPTEDWTPTEYVVKIEWVDNDAISEQDFDNIMQDATLELHDLWCENHKELSPEELQQLNSVLTAFFENKK